MILPSTLPAHLQPRCSPGRQTPSAETEGIGWRDVFDVVRTLVVTLSVCVRRFVCANEHRPQRSFDERLVGIDRGGASDGRWRSSPIGPTAGPLPRWPGIWECRCTIYAGPWAAAAGGRRFAMPGLGRHLAIDKWALKKGHP
jgi:hypothetical protein